MKLTVQKDDSLQAHVEYLNQLLDAHTTKEILNVTNGYFYPRVNRITSAPHIARIQARLGVDAETAHEVYRDNSK